MSDSVASSDRVVRATFTEKVNLSKDLKELKMQIPGVRCLRKRNELVERPCGGNMPFGCERQ